MRALRWVFVVAALLLLFAARPSRAQNVTAQSVTTQQLVLAPQSPITITGLQASPSVQGSTSYWYWVVAHVGSDVSAPQGPAVITNGPASLGGFAVNAISWNPVAGASSYDVLRTTSSTAPAGACNCAVIIGAAQFSATDSSNSLLSYTVSTSPDQVSAVCTNTNSCAGIITGVTVGAPNQQDIYLSPNCGLSPALGNCFQIHDDVIFQTGCTWLSASPIVNCAAGTFHSTAVDAGKDFGGYETCQTNAGPGVHPGYRLDFAAGTTILTVNSTSQAIVSNNSTNAETGTGCVLYGTPDDTGFAAAKAFWLAAPQCFSINLPSGIWALKDPHNFFGSNSQLGEPAACFQSGVSVGEGAGASYAITGTNPSTSIMWLPPDFVSANCNSQSEYGNACFWNSNGLWRNFQVTTGGLSTFGFAANHALFASAGQINGVTNSNVFAFFDNFYCVNVAPSDSKLIGFSTGLWWTEQRFVYADGCGGVSLQNLNANAPMKALDSKYENNCCGAAQYGGATAGTFVSMGGNQFWDGPLYGAGQPVLAGNVRLANGDAIFENGATSAKCWGGNGLFIVNSAANDVTCNEPTGMQAAAVGDSIVLYGWSYSGTGTGIVVSATGVTIALKDSSAKSITDGGSSAPTILDRGNNVLGPIPADAKVFGSLSVTGTSQVAGNIALTSGWSTSTVGTVSGASQQMQWTVTVAGTPAANPVITVTFPTAFLQAPLCQYQQEGGTFGVVTNPSITTTATAATLTFAGTPVAAQTYKMTLFCSNP